MENASLYAAISPDFARAFEILGNSEILHGKDGRYDLEGSRIWYSVQRYKTKPEDTCNFESHRKFIDIQLIVSGEEFIGHSYLDGLQTRSPYDAVSDKALYEHKPLGELSVIRLSAGMFGIFFPHDVHLPCLQTNKISDVHKVVVKVPVRDYKRTPGKSSRLWRSMP
jgi:YhcH/YjgK/YiaL family protein